MNIFVLDENPILAARMHCDKHVNKLVVETAQMMASALRRHGATDDVMPIAQTSGKPYKGGYHNHPCTVFVGDTHSNFLWTAHLGVELCKEFQKRFQRTHACTGPIFQMIDLMWMIPVGMQTDFARAFNKDNPEMADLYDKSKFTAVEAYREYYLRDKARFAKWEKGTPAPSWWVIE